MGATPIVARAAGAAGRHAVAPDGWMDKLNAQQREAVTWGSPRDGGGFESGPLLVIAGAGTGKTSTLAHRVAHLVVEGVSPDRILLMTFSRRAAQEMAHRAGRLVAQALSARRGVPTSADSAIRLAWAGTFHSIGARLLRLHASQLGLDASFGVIDRGDSADLIDMLRQQLGYAATFKRFPRKETCLAIYSQRVNTGDSLDRVLGDAFPWCAEWASELRQLFAVYVDRKQQQHLLDYDDLLLWWDAAMAEPVLAAAIGARFDHVLVDEYQDTNRVQSRLLHAMKPDGRGLTVVGDDAQSIYSFRAAEVGNILEFPQRFEPPAHRVTLETNYRSVQPVLDAANALLSEATRQYPKTLVAARAGENGARPMLVTLLDDQAQARHVADHVLLQREAGVALRRQAVLFRNSHHSDVLEVELVRRNVPFVKYGGLKFLEATHIKDLLAVLRWADNPSHGIAAFRVLQLLDGMGPINAQRCLNHLANALAAGASGFDGLSDFKPPLVAKERFASLLALVSRLGRRDAKWTGQVDIVRQWYEPILRQRFDDAGVRAADLDMLATIATQFGTRERFLTELTLDPPAATGDLSGPPSQDEDYLILSTVHSSKGQEWDSVYLLNVADGSYPNEFATGKPAAIEEERRLLYVAMTRARNQLQLIEPQRYYVTQQAKLAATYVQGARSRFLTDHVLDRLDRNSLPAGGDVSAAESETPDNAADGVLQANAAKASKPVGRGKLDKTKAAPVVDLAARMRGMW